MSKEILTRNFIESKIAEKNDCRRKKKYYGIIKIRISKPSKKSFRLPNPTDKLFSNLSDYYEIC